MEKCNHLFVSCKLEDDQKLYECLKCRERNFDIDRYSSIEFISIDKKFNLNDITNYELYELGDNFKYNEFNDMVINLCNNNITTRKGLSEFFTQTKVNHR